MVHAALSTALVAAALPVQVVSDGCPSGAEVESALASLLPPAADSKRPDVAHLSRQAKILRLQLVDAQGAIVGERSLEHDGGCADLATVAALVIASLESDVHPEFARPESRLAHQPLVVSPAEAPLTVEQRRRASYDLSASAGISYADSPAAFGTVSATLVPQGAGPGLRFSATGETEHELALGGGRVLWRRWVGSLEIDWRITRPILSLDVHSGVLLGWLTADGDQFNRNQSAASISPGMTVGARLSFWGSKRYAVGLDLAGCYWSRDQTVATAPSGPNRGIPHFQVLAGLAVSIGRLQ